MRGMTRDEADLREKRTSGERFEPWTGAQAGAHRFVVGWTTGDREYLVHAGDGDYTFASRAAFVDYLRFGQAAEFVLRFDRRI